MAAFSRLQLAAALLEYDNDPSDSSAPKRSAHDSAIFAHLRRLPPAPRRSVDYLGVSLPSETGSMGGGESVLGDTRSRASRGSVDILRNPFGDEDAVEDDSPVEDTEALEVDLASWGLDSFMPKEKGPKSSRNKLKTTALPDRRPVPSLRSPQDTTFDPDKSRSIGKRAMSAGNMDHFAAEGGFLDGTSSYQLDDNRRHSLASPLEFTGVESSQPPVHRRHISSHALIETLQSTQPIDLVPFPTGRSESPPPDKRPRASSRASALDAQLRPTHDRTYSGASMGSRMVLGESDQNRASQLDARHTRTLSAGTMGTLASKAYLVDDNPFSLRPPSRASKFDPKAAAHARTLSNASLGSRMLLEDDRGSILTGFSRGRPYSTMDLLRPKVLVMPSPLQPIEQAAAPEPIKPRDGFQLSTNGPPLPPGARSARRSTILSIIENPPSLEVPATSNVFTPNPRMSLTLSQLTFRNTLMVGGQRDVAYSDIDNVLPCAVEDGEQVHADESDEEIPVVRVPVAEEPRRPAGKLYGKSLIDDLEDRKAQLRSKKRVFVGDDRPSMMARGQLQRSGTLIDPASLQTPPTVQQQHSSKSSQDALGRRNSAIKPLLNFDDDKVQKLSPDVRIPKSRSVFGVDTLWEREMVKLTEIETREAREAEERQKRDADEAERERKKREKRKGKLKNGSRVEDLSTAAVGTDVEPRVSAEPPILPAIRKATVKRHSSPEDDDTDSDTDHSADGRSHGRVGMSTGAEQWYAGSSDEADDGPRRTTGTGLRYPKAAYKLGQMAPEGDDSDEDVPLAAAVGRVTQRAKHIGSARPDSDDEKPLSALLEKTKLSLPPVNFDAPSEPYRKVNNDDDDDKPLGLRMPPSHVRRSTSHGADDDDDRPLGFHPEHQRRTQYNVMAQQQQDMMMQAQMQHSMFFGPQHTMMGSGFFGQPIGAPMMMGPFSGPAMPSPPPADNALKYGRVDRWRHDVAVEGQR